MSDFTKIVMPMRATAHRRDGTPCLARVFCKIAYRGGELSITGVHGPLSNGDALGSCGQIDLLGTDDPHYAPEWDAKKVRRFTEVWDEWHLNRMRPYTAEMKAAGWHKLAQTPMRGYKFQAGDDLMNAARKAKAAALEALARGVAFTPTPEETAAYRQPYSRTLWVHADTPADTPAGYEPARALRGGGVEPPERRTLGWLKPSEHPEGLLGRKLTEDGPGYGSAWFSEAVPDDVLDFLRELPAATDKPAWV